MPSGNDYGYAIWQAIRHRKADALDAGRALDVEDKLTCNVVLVGKLACSNLLLEPGKLACSNLILEPGKLVHRQAPVLGKPEHKLAPEHRLVLQHKQALEHKLVPELDSKQVPVHKQEPEPDSKLVPVHRQVLEHRQVPVRKLEPGMLVHKLALEQDMLEHKFVPELGSIVALELDGSFALEHRLREL